MVQPARSAAYLDPDCCQAGAEGAGRARRGVGDLGAIRVRCQGPRHAPYARGEQVGLRRRLWPLSTLTVAQQFVSNRGQSGLVSDSIREDGPPVQKFGSLNKVHSRGLTDMTLGLLDRGAWRADDPTRIKGGHFIRPPTTYHNFITADGRPGPTGQGDFPAEAGFTIQRSCAPTLIASTISFMRQLIMVFTAPASPPSKGPTKKRHAQCLLLSIRSKIAISARFTR